MRYKLRQFTVVECNRIVSIGNILRYSKTMQIFCKEFEMCIYGKLYAKQNDENELFGEFE